MTDRPSAPAPRSSPSDWRTDPEVQRICDEQACDIRPTMGGGSAPIWMFTEESLHALCDAVASCGERGGGLDPATIEAAAKCVELYEAFTEANSGAHFACVSLAKSIRALSSSLPSTQE